MKMKIYVEGGGDKAKLKRECRRAFGKFFEKAGFKGKMPKIVACGSRQSAYDDFCMAMKNKTALESPVLLVDSETAISPEYERNDRFRPWSHLRKKDKWKRPEGADDNNVHLMVRCMEAWFMADKESLKIFFGQTFKPNSLPQNNDIESIPKSDLFEGLKKATKDSTKGEYGKSAHSFKILERIDPDKVFDKSKWAKRLKPENLLSS